MGERIPFINEYRLNTFSETDVPNAEIGNYMKWGGFLIRLFSFYPKPIELLFPLTSTLMPPPH